jgi:hypothetical protein
MAVNRKLPLASVWSTRSDAVRSLTAVTVAPGITCPCWSCTDPEIEPVTSWALAAAAASAISAATPASRANLVVIIGSSSAVAPGERFVSDRSTRRPGAVPRGRGIVREP